MAKILKTFASFYKDSDATVKFGIILVLALVALLAVVGVVKLIMLIVKKTSRSRDEDEEYTEPKPVNTQRQFYEVAEVDFSLSTITASERRTISCLSEEVAKFGANMRTIESESFTEEKNFTPSEYDESDIADEKLSTLTDRRKRDVKKNFRGLSIKTLKKEKNVYLKKQKSCADGAEKAGELYKKLITDRDNAQNDCAELYAKHIDSLNLAREAREKVIEDSHPIESEIIKARSSLETKTTEKEKIFEQVEENRKEIAQCTIVANETVIAAYQFIDNSHATLASARNKYRKDTVAYSDGVAKLGQINESLDRCLDHYSKLSKDSAESAYAIECIDEAIAATEAEIAEMKRKKVLEEERRRKAKAEEKARKKAQKIAEAEERKRQKQEEKLKAHHQDIQETNQKAEEALSRAEELDKRAEDLEREEAEIEAQKRAIDEERERERMEKEDKKAAQKAEEERKKAEQREKQKQELEALEELSEEEKEMRRELERMNGELSSRSSEAAEEGFVSQKRLEEIMNSQKALENEQAKRAAQKEAMRLEMEKKAGGGE